MRVVIGSDHAGFHLKEALKQVLIDGKHDVEDVGTHSIASTDYPDYAAAVAEKVAGGVVVDGLPETMGLVVCGTGIGVSIAANKVHGARAAVCHEPYSAEMARRHNDANVICMGERVVGQGLAEKTLKAFLETRFEGGRHQRRIDKITALDNKR